MFSRKLSINFKNCYFYSFFYIASINFELNLSFRNASKNVFDMYSKDFPLNVGMANPGPSSTWSKARQKNEIDLWSLQWAGLAGRWWVRPTCLWLKMPSCTVLLSEGALHILLICEDSHTHFWLTSPWIIGNAIHFSSQVSSEGTKYYGMAIVAALSLLYP